MQIFSCSLSLLLTGLLVTLPAAAETSADTGESGSAALQVRVLDGTGKPTTGGTIPSRSVSSFTVEVQDPAGKPVPNAAVVLRLPDDGASAAFADGGHSAVAYTDDAGRARLAAVQWGDTPGVIPARVTATSGTAHAGILLEETVVAAAAPGSPAPIRVVVAPPVPIATPAPLESAPRRPSSNVTPQPATLPAEGAESQQMAALEAVDASNVPLRRGLLGTGEAPMISISSNGKASHSEVHSKVKWIILGAAAAAGAGAAFALMHNGKSGTSSTSGITIGPPTISVGHP